MTVSLVIVAKGLIGTLHLECDFDVHDVWIKSFSVKIRVADIFALLSVRRCCGMVPCT